MPPELAFNTAASFTTNTNWQAYSGETTMSYLTQMAGLAYHNFVSAAVGIVLAIAFIRGIAQKEKDALGNFWVDLVRCALWVLLPICLALALALVSQGVVQNLRPYDTATLLDPQTVTTTAQGGGTQTRQVTTQVIAQGPVASQEAIKELGTNGGGFFNANSAHPFENPTPLTNYLEMLAIFSLGGGADLDARRHDRLAAARLGGLRGHGLPVPGRRDDGVLGRGARESAADRGRRRPARHGALPGRQHGGQGGPVRHRRLRALRHGHHRRELRRRQRHARLLHARSAAWCRS